MATIEEQMRALAGAKAGGGVVAPAAGGGDLIKQLQALMSGIGTGGATSFGRHDPYMGSVSNDMQSGGRRMMIPPSRGRDMLNRKEMYQDGKGGALRPEVQLGEGVPLDSLDPNQLVDAILMLQSGPVSPTATTDINSIERTKSGNMAQNDTQKALNRAKSSRGKNVPVMSDRNVPLGMDDYDLNQGSDEAELDAVSNSMGTDPIADLKALYNMDDWTTPEARILMEGIAAASGNSEPGLAKLLEQAGLPVDQGITDEFFSLLNE